MYQSDCFNYAVLCLDTQPCPILCDHMDYSLPGSSDQAKIPWRKAWQPTPVSLPGQRSLEGYSPCGHKELDMAECLSTAQHS